MCTWSPQVRPGSGHCRVVSPVLAARRGRRHHLYPFPPLTTPDTDRLGQPAQDIKVGGPCWLYQIVGKKNICLTAKEFKKNISDRVTPGDPGRRSRINQNSSGLDPCPHGYFKTEILVGCLL